MKTIVIAVGILAVGVTGGQAATYPVSGKWGYDSSSDAGPTACKNRSTVEFAGNRRFETGGKAPPDYRNVSIAQINATTFRVVDLFFTGMQRGNVVYAIHILDPDHIEMTHAIGGAMFRLRRCN